MNPIAIVAAGGFALNKIRELVKFNQKTAGNTSLTSITGSTRVEPIVIVSKDCMNLEYLPEVMQSAQSLFTGYYLQAVSLIANVKGIQASRVLDKLNPNGGQSFAKDWFYGAENYQFSLPSRSSKNVSIENFALESLDREDIVYNPKTYGNNADKSKTKKEPDSDSTIGLNSKDISSMHESANLSIGKMLNIVIQVDDQKITVPISIRLMVNAVAEKSIISMLTLMGRDTTLTERWHSYRSGNIGWKDLVFASDLIRESRKMMQGDKEGIISEIFQRSNNSKMNSLFGGKSLNLASASNIYVISKEIADEIEKKSGTKINNFKSRELMLDSGYCMLLIVVDKSWERVTFYHRGIQLGSTVGVKDMRASNKGGGPDAMEIMKAYMLGNQPTF